MNDPQPVGGYIPGPPVPFKIPVECGIISAQTIRRLGPRILAELAETRPNP